MGEDIFRLFNAETLRTLFKSGDNKSLLDDFSRFLAAYFLNFPPFWRKYEETRLPSLLEWSDYNDIDVDTNRYQPISRKKIAENLPPEFSPKFAVLLLCRQEHYLEATLYTDYFNDFRSGLIMRHLMDMRQSLNLFEDCCEKCLVENLIEASELLFDESTNSVMKKFLGPYIEASLQIDLVFETNFLSQIEERAILNMELLCLTLSDEVDDNINLPRPPIYSLPTQNSFAEPEVLAWNKIHFFIQIFLHSLKRTNKLHLLISCSISKIYQFSLLAKDDLTFYFIESDINLLAPNDELNFSRLILAVLRITYRDLLNLSNRHENSSEASILSEKYFWLKSIDDKENSNEHFEKWLQTATETDIQYLLTFLNFLQESNSQSEKFLPPLSSESKEKWKAHLIGGVPTNFLPNKNLDEPYLECLRNGYRMKIEPEDFIKIKFLAENFSSVSLPDSSLIQIALRIQAEDLCQPNKETVASNFNDFAANILETKIEPTASLLESIRSSIRRLSEMERNTYTTRSEPSKPRFASKESLKKFDFDMEKLSTQDIEAEIMTEQEFVRSIPYPSTSQAVLKDYELFRGISIDSDAYPKRSSPKTFSIHNGTYRDRSKNLDQNGYLYDIPGTVKTPTLDLYQPNLPHVKRPIKNLYKQELPTTPKSPKPEIDIDLKDELNQIGAKLSEIRQYLDHTTRNLKLSHEEKPKTVRKSLARQRRSARSWASSSSGLSSASSNFSISSPLSSIDEQNPMEEQDEINHINEEEKHLETEQELEKFSDHALQRQNSNVVKKYTKQKMDRKGYSSSDESSIFSSHSRSPPRSRTTSSKRARNFLQDIEPLPEPSVVRLERLDLGKLSPEPNKSKYNEKEWTELRLYEPETSKRDSAYISTERSIDKGYSEWLMKGQFYKQTPKSKFPDWLKLIPPSDHPPKSRLLELKFEQKLNSTQFYEQYQYSKSTKIKYEGSSIDSASAKRLETQTIQQQQKIRYVADMTEEQIQDLLTRCRS